MTLTPEGYRPRLIDKSIDEMLGSFGAVSIEGPKWCGKTWTARNHSNSEMSVAGKTGPLRNRDIIKQDPRKALVGDAPHLIDEWQEIPALWDDVRDDVDEKPGHGRYILTGSSVPRRDEYVHSGAGRICSLRMRTMTLYESGDSTAAVSLSGLFDADIPMTDCGEQTLEHIVDLVIRGGWPAKAGDGTPMKRNLVAESYVSIAVDDACRLDGRVRNSNKMEMLLKSLARNESTLVSDKTVMKDMERYNESISPETYADYTDCLYRIHLIEETPSFRPNVRSSFRVGKSPKRHLTDPSLSVAALKMSRKRLMGDLKTLGVMFEALCERDLQIYAESQGGRLFHYRDGRDREIDAVVELEDGRWGAFEIKLGFEQVDEAADNLLNLHGLFKEEGCPPAVLCVICGTASYAYTRPDGVRVLPITALGP